MACRGVSPRTCGSRRVAQLQEPHAVRVGLLDNVQGDPLDILVELRDPQRVVELVEVGEKRPSSSFWSWRCRRISRRVGTGVSPWPFMSRQIVRAGWTRPGAGAARPCGYAESLSPRRAVSAMESNWWEHAAGGGGCQGRVPMGRARMGIETQPTHSRVVASGGATESRGVSGPESTHEQVKKHSERPSIRLPRALRFTRATHLVPRLRKSRHESCRLSRRMPRGQHPLRCFMSAAPFV